jgi:uncharacterized membrane protein
MSAALSRCSLVTLAILVAATAQGGGHDKLPKQYDVTPIVAPPNNAHCEPGFAQTTFARRMNASGQIAGYQVCYEATGSPDAPFLFNFGWGYVFTPGVGSRFLPYISADAIGTLGRSVNDAGVAVGWEFTQELAFAPVWLPSGGASYAVASDPCADFPFSQADDINNVGSIAASAERLPAQGCSNHWILKRADGTEVVGPLGFVDALNDHDVLVGQVSNTARKWSPTLGDVVLLPEGVPGRERLRAYNINNNEEVVGEWQHINNPQDFCLVGADAVYWGPEGGTAQILPRLPHDTHAVAIGINNQGLIVGNSRTMPVCNSFQPDTQRAVIWHQGRVTDLNKLLKKSDAREIQLIQASDINDSGQIAAFGFYRNQPLDKCWDFVFNPDTGESVYDTTLQCHSLHSFLLTPTGDK